MTDVFVPNREQQRAAGYRGGKRIYKLTFEEADLATHDDVPLVIRAKSVSFRKLIELARVDTSILSQAVSDLSDDQVDLLMGLLADFADCIVEWNLVTEDGDRVEPSVDSLTDQDPSWVMRVFMAWFQAIASVPAPLAKSSPSGTPFPAGSVPMAPPSPSPSN